MIPCPNWHDRLAHLIHPYPAKLLVHIPFFFLNNDLLSEAGDLVLDPFCGSGTVLSEAQSAGRVGYGADANPLARLIARVKTTQIEPPRIRQHLRSIITKIKDENPRNLPDVVNINHWFYPNVVSQLQCLRQVILRIRDARTREFLLVCFSVTVRKVSRADPRLSVPVRLRLGQYPKLHPLRAKSDSHLRKLRKVSVVKVFESVVRSNLLRMKRLRKADVNEPCMVIGSDARNLKSESGGDWGTVECVADESIQLIITSPPYPGAQKYIRASSLSLGWLGLCASSDLRRLKGQSIGREEVSKVECLENGSTGIAAADRAITNIRRRNRKRAAIATAYLNEMRTALGEMRRVLKTGGHLVLVAANNRICGRSFKTVEYLSAICEDLGFFTTACFVDAIHSRGLMTKRNKTASLIARECVLVLTKGGLPKWCQQKVISWPKSRRSMKKYGSVALPSQRCRLG